MAKKITFIILCHNELPHTKACVQSIINSSPAEAYNFVFIDNGSSDGTYNYLCGVKGGHVIRNKENVFVNPARNQGLKHVLENDLGDYVCLCDNDITAGRGWLTPILEAFDKRAPEFYVPVSNTQPVAPFHEEREFQNYVESLPSRQPLFLPILEPFVGFCMFIRKEHVSHFYPIPGQLQVLCGDNWIQDHLAHRNVYPYRVSHSAVRHFRGATQRGMVISEVRSGDYREFDRLVKTWYKERGMVPLGNFPATRVPLL